MATKLRYPVDNEVEYKGRLVFEMVNEDVERASIVDLTQNFSHLIDAAQTFGGIGVDVVSNLAGGAIGNILGAAKEAFNLNEKNISEITAQKRAEVERNFRATPKNQPRSTKTLAGSGDKVTLYLPQAVQIADAVQYDTNVELGALGGAMARGLAKENFNTLLAQQAEKTRASVNAWMGDPSMRLPREQASLLSAKVIGKGSTALGNAVKAATGVEVNPNTRALFRSVPIRNFGFTFTLIPTSEVEAIEIENIIRFFRTELYPEALTSLNVDYGYKFPRRFLIRADYDNREIPGVRFLPAYLQNFTATYNPNGMGMHRSGRFSEYQITMNFTEGKALTKQDIRDGY